MQEKKEVDYGGYKYKGYLWHEDGRENLPDKRKKRPPQKPSKDKKKKIKMDKEGAFVAFTMLLCFLISFIIAETLGGANILSIFKKKAETKESYYAVAVQELENESLAAIAADELRQLGGGGYVIYDKKFYLIAGVYAQKSDAEAIVSRLDSYSASIYEINISEPELNWCKTADKDTVTDTLTYAEAAFSGLYNISVEIDKGNISETQAMSRIGVLYKKIEDITSELAKITVKESEINLIRLKAEITAALAMLNNLRNNALSRYNLVSDIRYTYTAILIGYKNLTVNI